MVIQHNLSAMNGNRQLNIVTRERAKVTEKLSSGYQINRAADDAAGLAISEKMRRQIRGLTQASYNAQDGISMVQIADGAMAEVHDMLQRGNELAIKAANDTLSPEDRAYLQSELSLIKQEIDAIQEKTTFNEMYVLKGDGYLSAGSTYTTGSLPGWVGIDPASDSNGYMSNTYTTQQSYIATDGTTKTVNIQHDATPLDFSGVTASNKSELIDQGFYCTCCTCDKHYSIRFTEGTSASVTSSGNQYIYNIGIDNITDGTSLVQTIIAGTQNGNPQGHYTMFAADPGSPGTLMIYDGRSSESDSAKPSDLQSWVDWKPGHQSYNIHASASRGLFGKGVVYESQGDVLRKKLILQVGAEYGDELEIKLPYISAETTGVLPADISTPAGARDSIELFKKGLAFVANERSRMGAYQNRLEHTVRNLNNVVENTTAAESRIRDTDMAKEMVLLSNRNILEQAGQSMLAQANQTNQGVLSMLQ